MTDSTVVANMIDYMRFVTHACDLFTLCMTGILIYTLARQLYSDQNDHYEKRKHRLYVTSIVYIMTLPM